MSLLAVVVATIVGAAFGHGARRSLPALIGLKDRSLPFRTAWLEISTAIFFAVTAWRLQLTAGPWPYLLVLFLLAISASDYMVKLIPDRLSLPLAALGVLAAAVQPQLIFEVPIQRWALAMTVPELQNHPLEGPCLAVLGAIVGFSALEAVRRSFGLLAGLEVMGLGDSKLALATGAFLGPVGALFSLPVAFLIGVVHGLICLRFSGQPHSPFGPPLALAGWATLLFHAQLGAALGAMQSAILSLPLAWLAGLYTVLIAIAALLIWRTRRKASEYEALIEEDYRQVEQRLED